jgi:hypothetical protein
MYLPWFSCHREASRPLCLCLLMRLGCRMIPAGKHAVASSGKCQLDHMQFAKNCPYDDNELLTARDPAGCCNLNGIQGLTFDSLSRPVLSDTETRARPLAAAARSTRAKHDKLRSKRHGQKSSFRMYVQLTCGRHCCYLLEASRELSTATLAPHNAPMQTRASKYVGPRLRTDNGGVSVTHSEHMSLASHRSL